MENTQENNKHICKHGDCCKDCCGCSCHHNKYSLGRFLVLLVGVLLAFWVGYKLGMIKGLIMGNFKYNDGYYMKMKYQYPKEAIPSVPVSTVTEDSEALVPVQQ